MRVLVFWAPACIMVVFLPLTLLKMNFPVMDVYQSRFCTSRIVLLHIGVCLIAIVL